MKRRRMRATRYKRMASAEELEKFYWPEATNKHLFEEEQRPEVGGPRSEEATWHESSAKETGGMG